MIPSYSKQRPASLQNYNPPSSMNHLKNAKQKLWCPSHDANNDNVNSLNIFSITPKIMLTLLPPSTSTQTSLPTHKWNHSQSPVCVKTQFLTKTQEKL